MDRIILSVFNGNALAGNIVSRHLGCVITINICRRNLLSALKNNAFLEASCYIQVSILVNIAAVAGFEISVLIKRFCRKSRLLVIATHNQWGFYTDFSDTAAVGLINDNGNLRELLYTACTLNRVFVIAVCRSDGKTCFC